MHTCTWTDTHTCVSLQLQQFKHHALHASCQCTPTVPKRRSRRTCGSELPQELLKSTPIATGNAAFEPDAMMALQAAHAAGHMALATVQRSAVLLTSQSIETVRAAQEEERPSGKHARSVFGRREGEGGRTQDSAPTCARPHAQAPAAFKPPLGHSRVHRSAALVQSMHGTRPTTLLSAVTHTPQGPDSIHDWGGCSAFSRPDELNANEAAYTLGFHQCCAGGASRMCEVKHGHGHGAVMAEPLAPHAQIHV